ncbi:hypothetical protein ACMAY5_00670 [Arenicellales bacterium nBUS_48]
MNYLEWNDAIGSKLFNEEMEDRPVLLTVDSNLISDISSKEDLIQACNEGPPWIELPPSGLSFFSLLKKTGKHWKDSGSRGNEYPYYIGYLSLLVLAAYTQEGKDYWSAFKELIAPMSMGSHSDMVWVTDNLWSDLEDWSLDDQNGRLGWFTRLKIQNYEHVGPIRGQALITRSEVDGLPDLFFDAGLDANETPSFNELQKVVRNMHPRFKRLIDSGDREVPRILDDVVRQNFEIWDGTPSASYSGHQRPVGGFVLTLRFRTATETVNIDVRCRRDQCPHDGFRFEHRDREWIGHPQILRISEPLVADDKSIRYETTSDELRNGLVLQDINGIQFSLRPKKVRVFARDYEPGIAEWIEVDDVPRGRPLRILIIDECVQEFNDCAEDLQNLKEIDFEGIPEGWRLYRCDELVEYEGLSKIESSIRPRPRQDLSISGGIRSGASRRRFMDFGPPLVRTESLASYGSKIPHLLTGGVSSPLIGLPDLGKGFWKLPDTTAVNEPIAVFLSEVSAEQPSVEITLYRSSELRKPVREPLVDSDGLYISSQKDLPIRFSGGQIKSGHLDVVASEVLPGLVDYRDVLLIGRRPDHFISCPSEKRSTLWNPVWMVEKDRESGSLVSVEVIDAADGKLPVSGQVISEPTRKWRNFFKTYRNVRDLLHTDADIRLWDRYVEAALSSIDQGSERSHKSATLADAFQRAEKKRDS